MVFVIVFILMAVPCFGQQECGESNGTCKFRENIVIMFNKIVYTCSECNGILLQEKGEKTFQIIYDIMFRLEKYQHKLAITVDNYMYILISKTYITIVAWGRTTELLLSASSPYYNDEGAVSIQVISDAIQFRSEEKGFTVIWREGNIVDIELDVCQMDRVEGLCGDFTNRKVLNKYRGHNGTVLNSSIDMCSQWLYMPDYKCYEDDETDKNELLIADTVCNEMSKNVRATCNLDVTEQNSTNSFSANVKACKYVIYPNCTTRNILCNCEALKYLLDEAPCTEDMDDLFLKYNCHDLCAEGFQWKLSDADNTCDDLTYRNKSKKKIAGCFCPKHLVKKGNKCISSHLCENCVCEIYGDPSYRTFDKRDYRFLSTYPGSYVLVQRKLPSNETFFKVLSVNEKCLDYVNGTCISGIIIEYNNTLIEIYRNKTVLKNEKNYTAYCEDTSCNFNGIDFKLETETNIYIVKLVEIHLVIEYKIGNVTQHIVGAVSIKFSSYTLFDATEGLCGTCNGNSSDEFRLHNGTVVDDVSTFALDWLEQRETQCKGNRTFRCVDICETKCPDERNEQCEFGMQMRMICACPDGYVEKNDKCIKKSECDACSPKPTLNIPSRYFNIDNCTNLDPIVNIYECNGKCGNDFSHYTIEGDGYIYKKKCHYCKPTKFVTDNIELTCIKGLKNYPIKKPIDCKCVECNEKIK